MQLEDELRNITLGDLTIHDYCEKIKKITDTLEGLGEKVKDRSVVLHALNGLPSKFESVASILRFSKPLPSFSEMRSILLVEESRLNSHRVTLPLHDNHPSSPSLLHVADPSSPSTRGRGSRSYRGKQLPSQWRSQQPASPAAISRSTPLWSAIAPYITWVGLFSCAPSFSVNMDPI
ncbi:uncharacterized protein LOC122195453 [Lactuca sativa]|uniref:uncharacterized protein LOC122195453 n=1 Tax=Lactuca sativa TaxID=4236 RepID=UPI001C693798|nr:uncharacterized protein LOC122195453 [Lactuca sativa]